MLVHISGARSHRLTFYDWQLFGQIICGIIVAVGGFFGTVSYLGIWHSLVLSLSATLGTFM
jgi:hypothetical protein